MKLQIDGGTGMEKRIQDELNVLKDIIVNTIPVEQINYSVPMPMVYRILILI